MKQPHLFAREHNRSSHSLQYAVAYWTMSAALSGMAAYSLIEYIIELPSDWTTFLFHHFLHVAVIGFAVWIASFLVIRRFVIEPVNHIFLHLRRVAAGRLDFLDSTVAVREVGQVVESVNHLVTRLRRTPEPDSVSLCLDHLRGLRAALKTVTLHAQDDLVPAMRLVNSLEGKLLDMLQLEDLSPPIYRPNSKSFDTAAQSLK